MRPMSMLLRSQCLLCAFVSVCVPGALGSLPQALPWHVPCPGRCVCHIKPWFSPDSVYHEAPTVDCNDLLLTGVPSPLPLSTHTLHLQGNNLSEMDAVALRRLPNLTDLDLSQNDLGCVRVITQNLSLPSLLSLHLEENQLSHLPETSFSSLLALQELFLSHNNLRSIAPGAFAGLNALLRLHLNNNRLRNIDPRWFGDLQKLEVLMLGGNPVETLPEQGFYALRSLRSLVLGGMGLRGLADNALVGLEDLESLSFYDNLLSKVPSRALRRAKGLKFLDLNKNRIKVIKTGDLRDMRHLKELGLNNMEELMSIERAALENLPELTKLEITNNPRLSFIHPEAFANLSRLESLMLNSNCLSTLHRHTMNSLPRLQEVSLHSNPLRCDCSFHWAAQDATSERQTSRAVRFIQPRATLCSEPPELKARRVREVSTREMSTSCLPTIPAASLPSNVGVREGGKLLLHCRALADPQPQLYWVTPSGSRLGPASRNVSDGPSGSSLTAAERIAYPSASSRAEGHSSTKRYRLLPEGTLEIRKVTSREAGLYTCVAENALGADTRSVTVTVRSREKTKKRAVAYNPKGHWSPGAETKLKMIAAGEHFAILSWQNRRNYPSARLSWQAVSPEAPAYTTRVLAGARSFNLTQLQAETFYRVCLHSGTSGANDRKGKASGRPRCVSFRTKRAAKTGTGPQLGPELAATLLMILALALMLLAGQRWDRVHLREVKSHKALIVVQKIGGNDEKKHEQIEKHLFHHDC
ncbi:leucine-rich repeat neuronal protein 2-like [Corythoichthys intestinalis]|uniref:leucine-rich repeat neuronal protein 2-like n=1 Tax=Corythoichthys intestinalis TaxID=161448 RepID=UPI0025A562CE|nr:leucine-rich repeat neuronal protein 2-like [Corythoichthys intestinalis]XP_061813928.1 leucine-rich repeat neuronal protein 2-like [Nerophis lumbriciformis]